MDSNYWHKKWGTNDIRFHQNEYHPWLIQNEKRFPKGKVLIPLCGKTLDILYLSQQGHEVVGAELSLIACEAFFNENKISYQTETKENFTVFYSDTITLWCGDFFNLPAEAWSGVTSLYDRAALVALPQDIRQKYAEFIISQAKICTQFEMFLITFEYPEHTISGPPFSVLSNEVHALYGSVFDIRETQFEKNGSFAQGHPKLSTVEFIERAYWGTKIDHSPRRNL